MKKKIMKTLVMIPMLVTAMFLSSITSKAATVCNIRLDEIAPEENESDRTYNLFSRELFDRVNEYRESIGVEPLEWDDRIYEAAKVRAKEASEQFSHQRPDGSWPENVFKELGIDYYVMGENLVAYSTDVETSFNAWYKSPGHRSAMENSKFKKSAIYVYKAADGYIYAAQEFMY